LEWKVLLLLDRADVLNLEALDPDQIAWASSANAAATRLAGGVSIQNSQFSSPWLTWSIMVRASSLIDYAPSACSAK
jgi:hypothetical protein